MSHNLIWVMDYNLLHDWLLYVYAILSGTFYFNQTVQFLLKRFNRIFALVRLC